MSEGTDDFSRFLELDQVDAPAVPDGGAIDVEHALERMQDENAVQSTAELSQLAGAEQEEIVQDAVSKLSDNVREEAVEIARDILRKLKITLGSALLEDGINLKLLSKEDVFGLINKVTDVFDYLVASARAMDEELLENAVIYNAMTSVARLKHAVSLDQLRRAQHDNQLDKASDLSRRIEKMPASAKNMQGTFGDLLSKIDDGMQLIMQQLQQRGTPDAMADNWRGLTNYSTINGRDTEADQREKRNAKSIEHLQNRQEQISRKAAQAEAQRAAQIGQQQSSREGAKLNQQTQQQTSKNATLQQKMGKLLGSDQIAAMQKSMNGYNANAAAVKVGIQENVRRNVKIRQEVMKDQQKDQSTKRSSQREANKDAREMSQKNQSDMQKNQDQKIEAPNLKKNRDRIR